MTKAFELNITPERMGLLYFDMPDEKVNLFNAEVLSELNNILDQIKNQDLSCLLIFSRKEGIFIAGADVREFLKIDTYELGMRASRGGQEVFHKLSLLPFPTIAVINGACMGGGTEMSLACTYRLATDHPRTRIALPEVRLGILPGWGGTQRLPKVTGLRNALDIILTGKNVNAARALKYGLIDKIVTAEWMEEQAVAFARSVVSGKIKLKIKKKSGNKLARFLLEGTPAGRSLLFKKARQKVVQTTGGHYPAPLKAVEVIQKTYAMPVEKGLLIEAQALAELILTPESRNLVSLFVRSDQIKKEINNALQKSGYRSIKKIAIAGAGENSGEIALLLAKKGYSVRLTDSDEAKIAQAFQQIGKGLNDLLAKKRINAYQYKQILHRISAAQDYSGFSGQDLIIENGEDNLPQKQRLLKEIARAISPEAILASTADVLKIENLGAVLEQKNSFVGIRFFKPVSRRLIAEITAGAQTDEKVLNSIAKFVLSLGKIPIITGDSPGFLVNRLLASYFAEAAAMLQEGISVEKIDRVMLKFGMEAGPFALMDELGADAVNRMLKNLKNESDTKIAESGLLEKMTENGLLGKKAKRGFYRYSGKKKKPEPGLKALVKSAENNQISAEKIQQRLVCLMVNEASRCLTNGVADSAKKVDLSAVLGAGFPPFLGGPLKFADNLGLKNIITLLNAFRKKYGVRFKPDATLSELADSDKTFHDFF
ncbi:MAG: hypothetical protein GXO77_17295 [Calditrichaeota bacterium]|nr:hypothetical protein [Calditrichota bacterium]